MRFALVLFVAVLFSGVTRAENAAFTVDGLFSDGMVLQQKVPIPVWGTAAAGSAIAVKFGTQEKSGTADETGKWKIVLDPVPASGTATVLDIRGQGGSRTIRDVLVGEVWLCSGQSNMALRLNHAKGGPEEIAAANDPLLRMFEVPRRPAERPWDTVNGGWVTFNSQDGRDFTAFGYYFAKRLRQELKVPVGLVLAAWPGSAIDAWLSREALEQPNLATFMPQAVDGWAPHHQPSNCFNGMIHPLIPYPLAGVLWYQGETDGMMTTQNPYLYRELMKGLVLDWRRLWNDPGLPFYWVQLPNLRGGKDWPILRESQAAALSVPHTGMITTIDIGTSTLLHPKNKDAFGERMAQLVLGQQYGKSPSLSPAFASLEKNEGTLAVHFINAGKALKTTDGKAPLAFEIAGTDGAFQPADAQISGDTVVLKSGKVAAPTEVRYAWQADPPVNLVGESGLPVAPFRTDKLPVKGQEFVWQALPEKAQLATKTSGADLISGKNPDWKFSSSEAGTLTTARALQSGAANIIFKDDETRPGIKFSSPTMIWDAASGAGLKAGSGVTVNLVLELIRASNLERGFDIEAGLKQADGTLRLYTLTIFPMQVRALLGSETRYLGTNLDNAGAYHEYRIAIRPDGVAQVYFDGRPMGTFAGQTVSGNAAKTSFVRFGKTLPKGFLIAHLASAGLDTTGAFAAPTHGVVPASGEKDGDDEP